MRASHIVMISIGLWIVGRWAHNKPAITIGSVASAFVLIFSIGLLDQGKTEEIAKGFAWILLAVAALNNDSPIAPVADLIAGKLSNKPVTPGD